MMAFARFLRHFASMLPLDDAAAAAYYAVVTQETVDDVIADAADALF